jgi:tetratricopeptide (TPR) repeat protein
MKRLWIGLIAPFLLAVSCKTSDVTVGSRSGEADMIVLRQFHEAVNAKLLGNYDLAITTFERVVKLDPENHASMYELAGLYLDKGRITEADYYARKATELDPTNAWYAQLYAQVLVLQGSYVNAASVYRELVQRHPERMEFYFDWAYVLDRAGKYSDAIKALDEAERVTGVREELAERKSNLYGKLGDMESAVSELEKLIAQDPSAPGGYIKLATLYETAGQAENAGKTYERLLKVDPNDGMARLAMADYYKRQGNKERYLGNLKLAFLNADLDIDNKVNYLMPYLPRVAIDDSAAAEALRLCDWLVAGHPENAKSHALRADFLYQLDSVSAALHGYYRALELDESVFTVWQQVLYLNSELEQFDTLAYWSTQVIDRYPNQAIGYFFKGVSENRLKNYREAIAAFDEAALVGSGNQLMLSEIYSGLGDAYHELSNHVASDSCYELSLQINPNNAYVLNNYSYYLSLRGEKLESAERMARKANELLPGMASFQDTYGWVLYQLGQYKEARAWLEKAMGAGGDENAVILEHYGDTRFRMGDTGAAVEYWQKAYGLEPSPALGKKIADRKL